MKLGLLFKKLIYKINKTFLSKFSFKIYFITIFSVCVALLLTVYVSNQGIKKLYNSSSKEINNGLVTLNKEYLNNYITITSELVETKIRGFYKEQAMTADIYQKFLDNEEQFKPLVNSINSLPFLEKI